jgi:SAM-dependent methyltransferase
VSADPQSSIDERNRAFWDELCGTPAAQALGITEITPTSLAVFDDWYMAYYPYLSRYLDDLSVEGRRVLEIGLGFGTVGQALAARGAVYTGADIATGPVAMMQDRLCWLGRGDEATAVQASALELPWGDESFDAVVSIGCLHHTGDLQRSISQVHRVLRSGGRAVVMLYYRHSLRRLALGLRHRLSRGQERSFDDEMRDLYDAHAAGDGAPYTDFVSRADVKRLFSEFSHVRIDVQNFDGFRFGIKREWFLSNLARVVGLDLYIVADKG